MSLTKWVAFLQLFPILATVALTGIFVWRRLYRELPFFFLYLVAALLIAATRYIGVVYFKDSAFFYIYWISDLAGTPLVFLAIYEVFLKRLFPGFLKTRFYRSLFPIVGAAILVFKRLHKPLILPVLQFLASVWFFFYSWGVGGRSTTSPS
jgi:hypothetical protein